MPPRPPRLTTAVIGAGPAGLLFAVAGRLLHARAGGDPEAWALRLYDKRDAYARTHRLRMDPAPYLAIQREVLDPRFDALVAFLDEERFLPEVNALEARLAELLCDLGVTKERLVAGDGDGEVTLPALRAKLEREGALDEETVFTVVGADSVHSTVREWVRGDVRAVKHTHERVARVRVVGGELAEALGLVDQYRLSKLLGSVVDYRLNRNGFAEVDLFLTKREHDAVKALGASPKEPVAISARMLGRLSAPLFRAVVEHLEAGPDGPGAADRQVLLYSTFELEHALMPKVAFEAREARAHVFLVGDAAVSLPFFRGMACLARGAHALARAHVDLATGAGAAEVARRYDEEVASIARDEIATVGTRALLVRGLREFARVSALVPFPIQSWLLSADGRERASARDGITLGLLANVGFAALALATTALGAAGALRGGLAGGWVTWLALAFEAAGGAAYHASIAFEAGPHRHVRRVWEIQIALVLALGVALAALAPSATTLERALAGAWWFLLGAAFVVGLYAYERLVREGFARAGLDGDR